jgi:hypothetical protein
MERSRNLSYGDPDPTEEVSDRIAAALNGLRERPPITIDSQGNVVADLGDLGLVRLTAIREVLRLKPSLVEVWKDTEIGIGWALVPDSTKRGIVSQAFDELRNRQWVNASVLYSVLLQEKLETLPTEPGDHTIERIFRSIASIGQAIRSTMPPSIKAEGRGVFVIYRHDLDWHGYWDEDRRNCSPGYRDEPSGAV